MAAEKKYRMAGVGIYMWPYGVTLLVVGRWVPDGVEWLDREVAAAE